MNTIPPRYARSAIAAAIACATLAACDRLVEVATSAMPADTDAASVAAGSGGGLGDVRMTSNAALTASVKAEFARDPDLGKLRIGVDTAGGPVSLNGYVPDPSTRERATQLASAVEGVTRVDNRLVVNQ